MTTKSILTVCIVLLASSCLAQTETPKEGVPAVVEGSNTFATDLYAKLASKDKGNLFFSPSSIDTALAMTCAGAAGDTAKQMAKMLHFSLSADKLHLAYADLLTNLTSPTLRDEESAKKHPLPAYQLLIANALWGQKNYGLKMDFTQLAYGGGLNYVNFAQTDEARETINDWVAQQTKDKIKDLIPEGALNSDTRMVLTNAIYFKSKWAEKFPKDATKKATFRLTNDNVIDDVPMMHVEKHFDCMENDAIQMLDLPYVQNVLSMIVFLPKKVDGIGDIQKNLTAANIDKWIGQKKSVLVQVTLPKFTCSQEFMLADALKGMGMTDAFDADKANFSKMTDKEKLFISKVIHKSFVAVDEEGTKAAAATAVEAEALDEPETPKVFKADHPFVFVIRHNATGEILFMGRLMYPLGESVPVRHVKPRSVGGGR
jgi:serpin B